MIPFSEFIERRKRAMMGRQTTDQARLFYEFHLWRTVEKPCRAVREYLAALDEVVGLAPGRNSPKVISPSDPASAWTAKANKHVQFGYGLNDLTDNEYAVIVDVEATPARTYDEVASTKVMINVRSSVLR